MRICKIDNKSIVCTQFGERIYALKPGEWIDWASMLHSMM